MPTQFSQERLFASRYEDIHLACRSFMAALGNKEVFLNFTIIYKSYKFKNITLIDEICQLINLDRETVIFQFITRNLFSIMWYVISTSIYHTVRKWNIFRFSYCTLSRHFSYSNFTCWNFIFSPTVWLFLFWALSSATK
jgi:hypothetical protein